MDVRTRAWRVLAKGNHLAGYRHLAPSAAVAEPSLEQVTLRAGEEAIGIYENPPGSDAELLVVTTEALRVVCSGRDEPIRYEEIESITGPGTKEESHPNLAVKLRNGAIVRVPVLGRKGTCLDVFEMLRFLMRVVEDLNTQRDFGDLGSGPSG